MVSQKGGWVYILTNKTHSFLYTGVTSDLITRLHEHLTKLHPQSFTSKYNCNQLVYYKGYAHIGEAIAAEKLIKGGSRHKKMDLINYMNPGWVNLHDRLLNDE